jgi:hypothetical protein
LVTLLRNEEMRIVGTSSSGGSKENTLYSNVSGGRSGGRSGGSYFITIWTFCHWYTLHLNNWNMNECPKFHICDACYLNYSSSHNCFDHAH